MIAFLSGRVVSVSGTSLVLDVGGVGFLIACPLTTAAALRAGQEATIHTELVVREDSLSLYGFSSPQEAQEFRIVQSATGIGPKTALAMVSTLTPSQLRRAVLGEDLVALSTVPGIGRKGAQRLSLELKDKVQALADSDDDQAVAPVSAFQDPVVQGLENLGYSTRDAVRAWEAVADLAEDESATAGALLKAALRTLARG